MPADPATEPLPVVAVTYSPGEALEGFLESVQSATRRPVHVVLADNGSTDGAPEALRVSVSRDGCHIELSTEAPLGYA